jgi:hypothetical protein
LILIRHWRVPVAACPRIPHPAFLLPKSPRDVQYCTCRHLTRDPLAPIGLSDTDKRRKDQAWRGKAARLAPSFSASFVLRLTGLLICCYPLHCTVPNTSWSPRTPFISVSSQFILCYQCGACMIACSDSLLFYF